MMMMIMTMMMVMIRGQPESFRNCKERLVQWQMLTCHMGPDDPSNYIEKVKVSLVYKPDLSI